MRTMRLISILLLSVVGSAAIAQPAANLPTVVPDEIVVGFFPGTPAADRASAHSQAGGVPTRNLAAIDAQVSRIAGNPNAALNAYRNNPNVRYAEPNHVRLLVLPDEGHDPPPPTGLGIDYFAEQYGLHNQGQPLFYDQFTGEPGVITGAADADIDAPEAWDLHTGSPLVTVAVLDSGVDCAHADLIGKCVESINLGPSDTLDDVIGHGTHVAGIAAATGNNGIGIAGVGWQTSIASIKVCYEYYDLFFGLIGLCDSAASAAGMIHAADQGYAVINMSYAGPTPSQAEADAAAYAFSQNTVLVAAAANDYDQTPVYPAGFDDVIAVAATDWYDNLAGFSNFGDWVSLAAPGTNVFATLPHAACGLPQSDPEGCYGWLSGTSMASPMVAGAAAVVFSYAGPGATSSGVRARLEANADASGVLGQNFLAWTTHGRLNLNSALLDGSGPPPPPADPGVHVGQLVGASTNQGSTWVGSVTITVHDESEQPADGITVAGVWSGGYAGAAGCTTTSGQCTVSTAGIPKRQSSVTFTVTGLTGGGPYQAGANHDPGDTLTVPK